MLHAHWHAKYDLQYHLVLVTKYRSPCLTEKIFKQINDILFKLSEQWGIEVVATGGGKDHIHITFKSHPSLDLSKLINNLKTITSRYVRRDFNEHIVNYLEKGLWSRA